MNMAQLNSALPHLRSETFSLKASNQSNEESKNKREEKRNVTLALLEG